MEPGTGPCIVGVAGGKGQRRASALQSGGTLVQKDVGRREGIRGDDQFETPVVAPPGVRVIGGVHYYSSAWLNSPRPVLASTALTIHAMGRESTIGRRRLAGGGRSRDCAAGSAAPERI